MTTSFLLAPVRYWNTLKDHEDGRCKDWFLVGSPLPILFILYSYHRFVTKIGPEFMKNRRPYNLDRIIQFYNLFQVAANTWLAFKSFSATFGPFGSYDWICEPMDKSFSPRATEVATYTYLYYMLKIIDLLDTVFFVLRKKFNQISFLHVYHHVGIAFGGYVGSKWYPDGHMFLLVPLNSLVHSIMYSYYFLTNYDPKQKKKIWWKKYVTQIQMVQFMILGIHNAFGFSSSCAYPKFPVYLFFPQNILMLALFWQFYEKSYLRKDGGTASETQVNLSRPAETDKNL